MREVTCDGREGREEGEGDKKGILVNINAEVVCPGKLIQGDIYHLQ